MAPVPHSVRTLAALLVAGLILIHVLGATTSNAFSRITPRDLHAPRVVVHKSARMLFLFDGSDLIRAYPLDLGSQPIGDKRIGPDRRTPEGVFRVVTKNAESPYHRFLGLNYPGENAIRHGLETGLISVGEAATLRKAHERGERPSWTTALGGGIGLHGHRKGYDWTGGCLALANEHVDELFRVLRLGDPVEILP